MLQISPIVRVLSRSIKSSCLLSFSFLQHQLLTAPEPPESFQHHSKSPDTRHQTKHSDSTSAIISTQTTMPVSSTCCGRSGQACVCAAEAKCSCGEKSALNCTCEKAKTENAVSGARCSCGKYCFSLRTRCCGELALYATPLLLLLLLLSQRES